MMIPWWLGGEANNIGGLPPINLILSFEQVV